MEPAPPRPPEPKPSAPRPKRRRWRRRLAWTLGTLVLLGVVVYFAGPPTAAAILKAKLPGIIRRRYHGTATVDLVRVSWSGRVEIQGLALVTEGGEEFARIPLADVQFDVGEAVRGRYSVAALVSGPRLFLRRRPDGRTNLDLFLHGPANLPAEAPTAAPAPSDPTPACAPSALPPIRADVKIVGGDFVVEENGNFTNLYLVDARVHIPALDQTGTFGATITTDYGRGVVSAEGTVTLARGGRIDPTARLDGRIDLPDLSQLEAAARLLSPVEHLAGAVACGAHVELDGWPAFRGRVELNVTGAVVGGAAFGPEPMRFPELATTATVEIDAAGNGTAAARILSGRALGGFLEAKLAAVDGADRTVDASFKLSSDLAELGESLRGLMRLKQDTRVTGRLSAEGSVAWSPAGARAALSIVGAGLAAVPPGGSPIVLDEKAVVNLDASFDAATKRLEVQQLVVDVPAIHVVGSGTLEESRLSAQIDLDRLTEKLATFVDLGGRRFGGRVTVDGHTATTEGSTGIDLEALAAGVTVAGQDGTAGPWSGGILLTASREGDALRGIASISARGLTGDEEVRLSLDAAVRGQALESLTLAGHGLDVQAHGTRERLTATVALDPAGAAAVVAAVCGLQISGQPLAGEFEIVPSPIEIRGSLHAPQVRATGGPLGERVVAQTEGLLEVDLAGADLRALRWTSSSARVSAAGQLGGRVDARVEGDLARIAGEMPGFVPAGMDVAGRADLRARYEPGAATLDGRFTDLVWRWNGKEVREPGLFLDGEAALTPGRAEIRRANVRSTYFTADVQGAIGSAIENVRITLRYVPDRMAPLLAMLAPGKLEGARERTVEVRLSGRPSIEEILGTLAVSVGLYTAYGLGIDGAVGATLDGGVARVDAPFTANGGPLGITGTIDLRAAEAQPSSSFALHAENVQLTKELAELLMLVHPVFHGASGDVAGQLRADLRGRWAGPLATDLPIRDAAARALTAEGSLVAERLRIEGSPFLGLVLGQMGMGGDAVTLGELRVPELVVRDGRVAYRDLTLVAAGQTFRFRGSVGFDESLDLRMEVPIGEALARKLPDVAVLLGQSFEVGVGGTVRAPAVRWGEALAGLAERAMRARIEEELLRRLGSFFRRP